MKFMKQDYLFKTFSLKKVIILSLIGLTMILPSFDLLDANTRLSVSAAPLENWEVAFHIVESSGINTTIIFGGKQNASDNQDIYDLPLPPNPPQFPFLLAWFETVFPEPFNKLLHEYKNISSNAVTYNPTIQWSPQGSSSTSVTISWDPSMINKSKYTIVNLCTSNETILANMRLQHTYTFTCPALIPHEFKIICNTNPPPPQPSKPSPYDGAEQISINPTLSWDCNDPDNDILTYDIYFGTTNQPALIVNNQSRLSLTVGPLLYQTTYYWKIIVWSNHSVSTKGPLWSFITEAASSSPNGGTNDDKENMLPIANASRSKRIGFVTESLIFDGSHSYDPDGYLSRWSWDFGDGTNGNGEKTTHAYQDTGLYTVTLKVTDNKGATADDTITVQITTANRPPTKPVITGTRTGTKNILYTYMVYSTDPENDFLQYRITWGDGASSESEFLPNGTVYSFSHSWNASGKYVLSAKATDNTTLSEETTFEFFIDVLFIRLLGFLFDASNDGLFDSFYSNTTGRTTNAHQLENGSFLLDTNSDGTWNYLYDPTTGSLTVMTTGVTTIDNPWLFIIMIAVAFVLIVGIVYLYKKNYF